MVEANLEIGTFFSRRPKFQNAVKLIKVWLAQRGLLQVSFIVFKGWLFMRFFWILNDLIIYWFDLGLWQLLWFHHCPIHPLSIQRP